jgi:hypothetical protein
VELADTSAWATRHRDPSVAAAFDRAVEGGRIATCRMVVFELLRTTRDARELAAKRDELDELRDFPIRRREWDRAAEVMEALAELGPLQHRRVPFVDLVIAAAAETAEVPIVHYDRHFDLIAEITGQPVRAIAPIGSL